jgi:hypothetical protein
MQSVHDVVFGIPPTSMSITQQPYKATKAFNGSRYFTDYKEALADQRWERKCFFSPQIRKFLMRTSPQIANHLG